MSSPGIMNHSVSALEEAGKRLLDMSQRLDIDLLDNVVKAMCAGDTMHQKVAQSVLTQLKENPDSWMKVDAILQYSQNRETKYFALQILENLIKTRWNALPSVQTAGIKTFILYSFGETVSIPMWEDTWEPESFYDKILSNRERNLHTLCLLDIKVKEPNLEFLKRGITKMEPPRFMSALLEDSTICIGLARVGSFTQKIIRTTLKEATKIDMGAPLHSLVIPAQTLHPLEEDMINLFTITDL